MRIALAALHDQVQSIEFVHRAPSPQVELLLVRSDSDRFDLIAPHDSRQRRLTETKRSRPRRLIHVQLLQALDCGAATEVFQILDLLQLQLL